MRKFLLVVGTRPEVIKMAPVYHALKTVKGIEVFLCTTGQHRELVYQAMDFFELVPDYDLRLMKDNQSLDSLLSAVISGIGEILQTLNPDDVIVQGDTTTVLGAAISSFHHRVRVVHLEAGLRSFIKHSPFPEEMNRLLTSRVADVHLAPTLQAAENLFNEGIKLGVHVVGNTVIDALFWALNKLDNSQELYLDSLLLNLDVGKKWVLVTTHRRENFGEGLEQIVEAIQSFALEWKNDVIILLPVHPNPNVKEVIGKKLSGIANVILTPPLNYPQLVYLMSKSYCILTDSGGIQEEAPSLKKPVLVMRENTERPEGVEQGNAVLVGTDKVKINNALSRLMSDPQYYQSFLLKPNPYGDGHSAQRIVEILC